MIYLIFLRGVNMMGHNMVKMAELCHALEPRLGNVQHYIQSGHLCLRSRRTPANIYKIIQTTIEQRHGFRPAIIIKTPAEIRHLLGNRPADWQKVNYLLFDDLQKNPKIARLLTQIACKSAHTASISAPPFVPSSTALEKQLNVPLTMRNERTLENMLSLAKAFAKKSEK